MSFTGLGTGRRVEGRAERGRLQRIKGARHARLACEALEDRIALAISTWSGLASTLWSGAGNWDVPAVAGNSLVFPAAATQKSSVNDLAAGSSFPALTISGAGYQISGNKAAINAIDDSQTSGTNTLSLPLDLSAATTATVDNAPETLVLTNALTGSAAFGKFGSGTLSLTGTST